MTASVLTSIAPSHPIDGQQQRAAQSWLSQGYTYITVNAPGENIETHPDVIRKEARDTSSLYGRPYVLLDDVLNACTTDIAIITNSDIELTGILEPYLARAERMVTIANRMDHNGNPSIGKKFESGFDLFIIHRKFFQLIPPSLFVLGQTTWDYFIPYILQTRGVPVKIAPDGLIAHHLHRQQYDHASWVRMTEHFKFITGVKGPSPQHVSNAIYRHILHHGR